MTKGLEVVACGRNNRPRAGTVQSFTDMRRNKNTKANIRSEEEIRIASKSEKKI